ncbi:efflux RND transporter permease subunit, partial [Myxococcota bacterium]|nr:efflux RND transporter permease subunit [Myxococcota bacterium]MBU1536688.1 efflux RND transporter permease subunit [Myxococcota bacterium]
KLLVWSPVYGYIPLSQVARRVFAMGPNVISHENGQRRILITGNFSRTNTVGLVKTLRKRISREVPMPSGYSVTYGGQFENESRSTRSMLWALVFIVIAIGSIFYFVFKSFWLAILLLLNLPFAASGGVIAMALMGIPLSVASMLGFIALFGVAVRNGIILVSHYRHLRSTTTTSLPDAVTRGSIERLSPILMTALTSMLALTPLVLLGDIPGNEIQSPMAVVIVGGLFTSTTLSLLILPGFYLTLSRFLSRRNQKTPAAGELQ